MELLKLQDCIGWTSTFLVKADFPSSMMASCKLRGKISAIAGWLLHKSSTRKVGYGLMSLAIERWHDELGRSPSAEVPGVVGTRTKQAAHHNLHLYVTNQCKCNWMKLTPQKPVWLQKSGWHSWRFKSWTPSFAVKLTVAAAIQVVPQRGKVTTKTSVAPI